MEQLSVEFPLWVRLTHFFNFLFLSLLVRSGIEIIGAHPRFYWNDHCEPGSEWLNFLKKKMPRNKLWTAEDEIKPLNSWVALPGGNNLGMGRHWHYWSVIGWLICGLFYVSMMWLSPHWQRLVPASWEIFPRAWKTFLAYLSFEMPQNKGLFNPLQKLSYFCLVYVLTPIQILSGIAMAPAISGRFPAFVALFGGRQGARSVHFIGLLLYLLFFVVHLFMVFVHGFGKGMARIVLGSESKPHDIAVFLGLAGILLVVLINVVATYASLKHTFRMKKFLELGVDSLLRFFFHHQRSVQNHQKTSPTPRANGRPPKNELFQHHLQHNFRDFRLKLYGLVETPLAFNLQELKALPKEEQSTLHICIQGWSYYAQWGGVHLKTLLDLCRPLPKAKYLVFHTMDEKWEHPEDEGYYYEVIDLELACKPQSLLAYEMNRQPLPLEHGAPLRLRLESQLGYKMAKYVSAIELVEDFSHLGKGQGGWRDDVLNYFVKTAGI